MFDCQLSLSQLTFTPSHCLTDVKFTIFLMKTLNEEKQIRSPAVILNVGQEVVGPRQDNTDDARLGDLTFGSDLLRPTPKKKKKMCVLQAYCERSTGQHG